MSRVSIFEKKWLDLVFEGKNKEYGAYQLRQENSKTTIKAFLFGIFFIMSVSSIGMLFSSFTTETPKPKIIDKPIICLYPINLPIEEPIVEPIIEKPKTNTATEPIVDNRNFVVAPTDVSNPDISKNVDVPKNPTTPSTEPGTGTGPTPIKTTGGEGETPKVAKNTEPFISGVLDEQPDYPTGISGFRKEVGKKFNAPETDNTETSIASVLMSFVIETDGSMSNIKVLKSYGTEIDNEAIRVLKSIKTKWKAGKKDGQSVRTYFTLPIKIEMN